MPWAITDVDAYNSHEWRVERVDRELRKCRAASVRMAGGAAQAAEEARAQGFPEWATEIEAWAEGFTLAAGDPPAPMNPHRMKI